MKKNRNESFHVERKREKGAYSLSALAISFSGSEAGMMMVMEDWFFFFQRLAKQSLARIMYYVDMNYIKKWIWNLCKQN